MRLSAKALESAFIKGVTEAGADVLDLGLVSTDALYFAVGHLQEPGSHDHGVAQPQAVQRVQAVPRGRYRLSGTRG
jgi:phosphomannomutase